LREVAAVVVIQQTETQRVVVEQVDTGLRLELLVADFLLNQHSVSLLGLPTQ
jgi:hypothetical protein